MIKSVMVFTPVYKLEDRTISAIMALEWDGPLTFVMQRDNPIPVPDGATNEERHQIGVKNHLHQYQKGREIFLRGDYDALLVIEDDMIPPPDRTIPALPAVAVHGEADQYTPPRRMREYLEGWPAPCEFRVLPGADHFFEDHLPQVLDVLSENLKRWL